jgi:hypothetical protein
MCHFEIESVDHSALARISNSARRAARLEAADQGGPIATGK